MNRESPMMCGTVSGFDAHDRVGLIDADDGNILLFSAASLDAQEAARLTIGVRVQFLTCEYGQMPHADRVRIYD